MPSEYPEFIQQHFELVLKLEEIITISPNQVVRSARQAIRQLRLFEPADEGEETLKEVAIETYDELADRAQSIISGRGGI